MRLRVLASVAMFGLLAMTPPPVLPGVFPPNAVFYGQTYGEWTADWWTWFMQHPLAGHPALDDGLFNVTSGQSGPVWFLGAPLDFGAAVPRTRNITVPSGKALLVGLIVAEMSSLEGVPDEPTQRAVAQFLTDHAVSTAFSLDGQQLGNVDDYRFQSPQFTFTAPDPWIFGPGGAGQTGTSVADGYFVGLAPMSRGLHTLHFTGGLHFDAGELGQDPVDFGLDMTYHVTVQ